MRPVLEFGIRFAVIVPVSILLTAFVQWQSEAMGASFQNPIALLFTFLVFAYATAFVVFRCQPSIPKKKSGRCTTVTCVSLNFRT